MLGEIDHAYHDLSRPFKYYYAGPDEDSHTSLNSLFLLSTTCQITDRYWRLFENRSSAKGYFMTEILWVLMTKLCCKYSNSTTKVRDQVSVKAVSACSQV